MTVQQLLTAVDGLQGEILRQGGTPMSLANMQALVSKIQLDDSRQVDRLVLLGWYEKLGDLNFEEARDAVLMHRKESPDYLQAAHVRANVKLIRKDRARSARVDAAKSRGAIEPRRITLDKAKFEADTLASIRSHRIARGVDPDTGKAVD
ncbi:hypothetical protein [Cryobacterium psychrophilum]|uniref:Uncharacterized protein n=1 Tax=Cryobacterium psychrophilum TaxID=41988 RepID=A0A4Y8KR64_9MICO|nr:hypothetical protein [Cryobacterium psychrophilum]TFD80856.1 hypothetical protein E3T53_04330 [Cryobacterium psychrophilum]